MKLLKLAGRSVFWCSFIAAVSLLSFQSSLIYFPRAYDRGTIFDLERRQGQRLEYTTSQGRQTAFYLPPRGNPSAPPAFVWLVFGGNGSLALDYAGEPLRWDPGFGYLFVDYPGYGFCEGSPDPVTIEENAVSAAGRLCALLDWSEDAFRHHAGVYGHSIGCAAALIAADVLQLRSAVLCAPFTTLTDMARRIFGWPLCLLNRHRFDNLSRLASLESRGARVRIFHGTDDEVIPVAMSRTLVARYPDVVRLTEVAGAWHNDVVMASHDEAGAAMLELSRFP